VEGLIAVSRVVRGSHFVSDVTAGVVLGVLVGSVVAYPLRDWRRSLAGGLTNVTPYLAGAFALLSTFYQPASDRELQVMMLWAGSAAVAFGAGNRWGSTLRSQPSALLPYSAPAIGAGLALTTGAWLVVLVAGLVIAARWLLGDGTQPVTAVGTGSRAILAEAAVTALLILAILSLQGMKGVLLPS
jgi:undecaprenyl-diphosphatase